MVRFDEQPLEAVLRLCAESSPQPWYPSRFAQNNVVAREALDHAVDELRLAGLIHIVDWMQGSGQGYSLTNAGRQVLETPRLLAGLRDGVLAQQQPRVTKTIPSRDQGDHWSRIEAVRASFSHASRPTVTLTLIALNLAWFVAGMSLAVRYGIPLSRYLLNSDDRVLQATGALIAPLFLQGQWVRLLSYSFVHIGLIHLLVNMYSLWIIGPLLEQLWGAWRFLLLYMLAAFAGGCGMLVEVERAPVPGAGASGAIWGILASMATWLFLNRHVLPGPMVALWRRQLWTVFLLNVFITFAIPGISKGAHFGGGLIGLIAAVPVDYLRFGSGWKWWFALISLILIPVICLAIVFKVYGPISRPEATEPEDRVTGSQWARSVLNHRVPDAGLCATDAMFRKNGRCEARTGASKGWTVGRTRLLAEHLWSNDGLHFREVGKA